MNRPEERPRGGAFVLALVLYGLVMCLIALLTRPAAPNPADAPADQFSGVRAKAVLGRLVGNGVPHPVGSAANRKVRDALVAQLAEMGYQPRVQDGFACDEGGACAAVKNILARLDGRESGPAVMVAAHYDSVPAGPGASDDGAGTVSVLEIARALRASSPLRHPVIFLMDEGEEAGLLGAAAFVESDPWAGDVRAVVNMDNRGTSGASTMFETGDANEWVMHLYAKSVRHPNTDSLSYTVYKTLPNDTDFTVFKRDGYQGFNFAFLNDVARYHTPLDNVRNTSVSSIQSEGQSGLEAVRALANSDLNFGAPADAVYADLLGWKTIWWPARWTVGFAAVALILLVFETIVLVKRGEMRVGGFFGGLASWPLTLIAAAILGLLLQFFLRVAGAMPANWVAYPAPLLFAAWALGFAAVGVVAALLGGRAGFWGMWSGMWIWWAVIALWLGVALPGLDFIFVIAALAAGIFGLAGVCSPRGSSGEGVLAAVVPAAITALTGLYAVWFLYAALGGSFLTGIAVSVALISTPLGPLAAAVGSGKRWRFSTAALAIAVVATAAALIVPPFSAASPEALNLQYHQDADSGKTRWLAYPDSGRLPLSLRSIAPFAKMDASLYPWQIEKPLAADAPALNLPAPTLAVEQASSSGGESSYDVVLKSPRGAPIVLLALAPEVKPTAVSMAGHAVPELSSRLLRYTHGWRIYNSADTPPEGIEMKFTIPGTSPVSVFLLDESFGLPPGGRSLEGARPQTTTEIQSGDTTVVTRRITLKPQ